MSETSRYPVVCFGEVLWDILPSGAVPGGAPMNVAYHLRKFGDNPALITKVGRDKYGKDLINILTHSKTATRFLNVDSEHPTGLVHANINDHHEVVYNIVYPSAWDFINTIGSGDAFLAGFLDQLLENASIGQAFASGLGAFVATHTGGMS